jgi:hypothetical protein
MAENELKVREECVSEKSWREVLSRSLKIFMFNASSEAGRSFGKAFFFVLLGLIGFVIGVYVIDSFTGWFSSIFDSWPFASARAGDESAQNLFKLPNWPGNANDGDVKWYCTWNPLC